MGPFRSIDELFWGQFPLCIATPTSSHLAFDVPDFVCRLSREFIILNTILSGICFYLYSESIFLIQFLLEFATAHRWRSL